jgi:DNA polymerase/3'-5' exonuclease PolX
MLKKQSTLFPQDVFEIVTELDLEETEKTATLVKASVEFYCEQIEIAGSMRRSEPRIHDIDFVLVAKSDAIDRSFIRVKMRA